LAGAKSSSSIFASAVRMPLSSPASGDYIRSKLRDPIAPTRKSSKE
jgi:hypothetical protein